MRAELVWLPIAGNIGVVKHAESNRIITHPTTLDDALRLIPNTPVRVKIS